MPDPDAQNPPDAQPPGTRLRVGTPRQRAPLAMATAIVALAGVIAAYALVGQPTSPLIGRLRPDRPLVRQPAPPFSAPSLGGPGRIALADFSGTVVVLNFFASWCGPCELEAADLQRTWLSVQGRGVAFVGIAIQDQEREAKAFLAKHGITYPAAFDTDGAVMRGYRIVGIPTTVIIDREGRIAERYAGIFVGDEGRARLLALIEAARVAPR